MSDLVERRRRRARVISIMVAVCAPVSLYALATTGWNLVVIDQVQAHLDSKTRAEARQLAERAHP